MISQLFQRHIYLLAGSGPESASPVQPPAMLYPSSGGARGVTLERTAAGMGVIGNTGRPLNEDPQVRSGAFYRAQLFLGAGALLIDSAMSYSPKQLISYYTLCVLLFQSLCSCTAATSPTPPLVNLPDLHHHVTPFHFALILQSTGNQYSNENKHCRAGQSHLQRNESEPS